MSLISNGLAHLCPVSEGAKLYRIEKNLQPSRDNSGQTAALPLLLGEAVANWYAVYICARHEKKVVSQMEDRQLQCFLPLYRSMRRWKDRLAEVAMPLFPGYAFVRINPQDQLRVLRIPSVVRFVSFNGSPAILDQQQIDELRDRLLNGISAEPYPYLKVGRRVRVQYGPLAGMEGILLRKKDKLRVVISVELLMRSIVVDVQAADLAGTS
jgi:transcription antitermination factor NusG